MSADHESEVLVVCLNPTLQETMVFSHVRLHEVNRARFHQLDASGKGMNVCRVLSQLGGKCALLSHLGGPRIQEFLDLAARDGVPILWEDGKSPIRTCITVLQESDSSTTELVQESETVGEGTEESILKLYAEQLKHVKGVVFSGSRSPGYSDNLYADMVRQAKKKGVFVIVDYRGEDLKRSLAMRPDIIKPNLVEFCATFLPDAPVGGEMEDSEHLKDQVVSVMRSLYEQYRIMTIITRGGENLWAFDGAQLYEIPSRKVKAQNTIGCGDAFTAGFVHAHLNNASFTASLYAGQDAASRNAATLTPGSIHDDRLNSLKR